MKPLITILDNDPAVLELLDYILSDAGYEVNKLTDLTDLERLIDTSPNLIILDEKLDTRPGHEICNLLKADPAAKSIPVMLLSAVHNLEAIARKCNADIYIEKPIDLQHLLTSIAGIISNTSARLP